MCNNGCMLEMSVKHIHNGSICLLDWVCFCWWWSIGWLCFPTQKVYERLLWIHKELQRVWNSYHFFSKYSERCRAGSCPKADPGQGRGSVVSCGVWFSCMTSDHGMPSCKSFLCIEQAQCLESAWASPPQPEETWLFSPTHLQTTWSPCGEDAVYVKETDN